MAWYSLIEDKNERTLRYFEDKNERTLRYFKGENQRDAA
jgi:hypothetical protein